MEDSHLTLEDRISRILKESCKGDTLSRCRAGDHTSCKRAWYVFFFFHTSNLVGICTFKSSAMVAMDPVGGRACQ